MDFELKGIDNRPVVDEDFRGRYLLITFGFTHCEHICPLMAASMGSVLESTVLPAAGLFISVDPDGRLLETFPLNATPDEITGFLDSHASANGGH